MTHRSGFPYNLIQARLQHETGIRPATQFYFPRRVWPHREILAPTLTQQFFRLSTLAPSFPGNPVNQRSKFTQQFFRL
ncbi:MAG: hypothetical protein ACK56F_33240 [bacterium]